MAFYVVEEDVWKCPKHPSRRRRSGICPICLRDRLIILCPHCANVRPCACCSITTSSSSSSSSADASKSSGAGDPSFRRSRSVAIPFLRSRFSGDRDAGNRSKSSIWSVFKTQSKNNRGEEEREDEELENRENEKDEYANRTMIRSRSISVPVKSNSFVGDGRSSSAKGKGKGWYFRSPIKAFWQLKNSKLVHEQSPLHRG